jgi:integral membrane protein
VKSLLTPYRVMANIVGVLLIILVLIGLPLHYGHVLNEGLFPEGGTAETLGANISRYLGVAHGWLYMIFLVVAFALSRRARWDLGFTAVTLLAGTVPILSFWAEHRATADVRRRIAAEDADRAQAGSPAEPTQG